jgi:hypothetical protein
MSNESQPTPDALFPRELVDLWTHNPEVGGSLKDGFFINTERNPKPNYLVLHVPRCGRGVRHQTEVPPKSDSWPRSA